MLRISMRKNVKQSDIPHTSPLLWVENPGTIFFVCLAEKSFRIFCRVASDCCSNNLRKINKQINVKTYENWIEGRSLFRAWCDSSDIVWILRRVLRWKFTQMFKLHWENSELTTDFKDRNNYTKTNKDQVPQECNERIYIRNIDHRLSPVSTPKLCVCHGPSHTWKWIDRNWKKALKITQNSNKRLEVSKLTQPRWKDNYCLREWLF